MEFLLFLTLALTGYLYLASSFIKLGGRGLLDALAIYSFIIAGFLFILISEVADSYYLRAFSSLVTFVGMFIGFYFIFKIDAPHLPAEYMGIALISFILAMALALFFFVMVVGRLIMEKLRVSLVARVTEEAGREPMVSPLAAEGEGLGAQEPISIPTIPPAEEKPLEPPIVLACIGGPYLGKEFSLGEGETQLGRTEGQIVLSDDPQVSRRHALFIFSEGKLKLRDLGSTNGTWVNGIRITESEVRRGDIIALGQCRFTVR